MNASRRLAAIMFTDIVGYTSMIIDDESGAINMVTHHKKVIEKSVNEHEGDLIQFYGDGSLSIYSSATAALECAIAIQKSFQGTTSVPLRIGIHIGEILLDEGNIYGEGVNIASRIESIGQVGTILYSGDVYQKIRTNKNFKSTDLGFFQFKNVENPMQIYALANKGFPVPQKKEISGKLGSLKHDPLDKNVNSESPTEKSIAVLPFENNSSMVEQQYFVDGIADEIRSQLLAINDLKVISRASCMYYKNKPFTLSQIKKELDVTFVLEGRVQAIPTHIKVNVELSNTITNKQVWSLPPLNKKLEDLFELQNEIAKKIVSELKIALSTKEKKQLNKIATENHEAYKYFQKGQDLLHRGYGKNEELNAAKQAFLKAIEIDPKFSRAYVGLSDTYLEHIFWGRIAPIKVLEPALQAALKALDLDSTSGESYGALGAISFYKFQKSEAINFLNRAIELSPNYLGAHEKLAWITIFDGHVEKAIELFSKAQSLDPLSTKYMGDVGHAYYYSRRFEEGISVMDSFLKKHPNDPWLLWMKGYLYSGSGNYNLAIQTYLERSTGTRTNWMLAYNYGKTGAVKEAQKILDWHLEKQKTTYVPGYMIATIFMGLGEHHKALDWLEKDDKDGGLGLFTWGLKTDPKFEILHTEDRFITLLEQIEN